MKKCWQDISPAEDNYIGVLVRSLADDPNYVKCPRCWYYHTAKLNHIYLCDRCCSNIIEGYPEQVELIANIRAAYREQAEYYSVESVAARNVNANKS